MYPILLILGLLLWAGAHLFRRLAPQARARMGAAGRPVIAGLLLLSVVLMVLGFRGSDFVFLWDPPRFLIHVNNLMMLGVMFLYAADGMKAPAVAKIRHPQLTAVKIWALAHLLVNGDLYSVILFGGILAWAVVEVIVINRTEPWVKKPRKPGTNLKALLAAIVVLAIVMFIHSLLGPQPWA